MPNDIDWAELERLASKVRDPFAWSYVDVEMCDNTAELLWLASVANAYPAIKAERERLVAELDEARKAEFHPSFQVEIERRDARISALADENRQLRRGLEHIANTDTRGLVIEWGPFIRDLLERLKGEH